MDNENRVRAQKAQAAGGLLIDESGPQVRVSLTVDPNEPMKIFDKLNELEVELVNRAGNDIKAVTAAGEFVDDIRKRTTALLKEQGLFVE